MYGFILRLINQSSTRLKRWCFFPPCTLRKKLLFSPHFFFLSLCLSFSLSHDRHIRQQFRVCARISSPKNNSLAEGFQLKKKKKILKERKTYCKIDRHKLVLIFFLFCNNIKAKKFFCLRPSLHALHSKCNFIKHSIEITVT